jgi:hypothetical protein
MTSGEFAIWLMLIAISAILEFRILPELRRIANGRNSDFCNPGGNSKLPTDV